jgi:hypothetical protein
MKYFLVAILLQIFSFQVLAEKIRGQISSLDIGVNGQEHLVKLSEGQVAFIDFSQKALLDQIVKSFKRKDWLEFTLGSKNTLQSIKIIAPQFFYDTTDHATLIRSAEDPYRPTVMTLTNAKSIFSKMRKDYQQKSQCFNRAHIWTYEEFIRSATNMNKVFLFFTSRYIRSHHFGWWFHVTPMVFVGGTKQSNWKILDRRYTKGPINSKTWTDIFIRTKKTCKVVNKYSSYHEHQQSQDCYMIPVSMYYVVPSDIERLESTGEERIGYEEVEVEYAEWEAF